MNSYKLISEIIFNNHPNTDMLISKPYLYVYIHKNQIDDIEKNGIDADESNIIRSFFARLPESKYFKFLKNHIPIRIFTPKLFKIENQKVLLKPVNFDYFDNSLDLKGIEKIVQNKMSDYIKIYSKKDIDSIPRVDIFLSKGNLPSYTFKILN